MGPGRGLDTKRSGLRHAAILDRRLAAKKAAGFPGRRMYANALPVRQNEYATCPEKMRKLTL